MIVCFCLSEWISLGLSKEQEVPRLVPWLSDCDKNTI